MVQATKRKVRPGRRRAKPRVKDDVRCGFDFPSPSEERYTQGDAFLKALRRQKDAVAQVDGKHLREITLEGQINGTDLRLSHAAFADLCGFAKMPVGFIRRLSVQNEGLALNVVHDCLNQVFHNGSEKSLVVHEEQRLVYGIVGKDSYSPLSNFDAADYALSGADEVDFKDGWLAGPRMRMTALRQNDDFEPQKGDVVRVGMSIENAINGDLAARIAQFAERLVCSNGMVRREGASEVCIRHTGDIHERVQEAVIEAALRAETMAPLMAAAASPANLLDVPAIRSLREFTRNPRHGGSESLERETIGSAKHWAMHDGRRPEELTLWNWINGITSQAKNAKSLTRRTEIETLGYKTLDRYGAALLASDN